MLLREMTSRTVQVPLILPYVLSYRTFTGIRADRRRGKRCRRLHRLG